MKEVGYYNGTIGPLSEINCPILDRAVYFGDGCYDATYVQNGVILHWKTPDFFIVILRP